MMKKKLSLKSVLYFEMFVRAKRLRVNIMNTLTETHVTNVHTFDLVVRLARGCVFVRIQLKSFKSTTRLYFASEISMVVFAAACFSVCGIHSIKCH